MNNKVSTGNDGVAALLKMDEWKIMDAINEISDMISGGTFKKERAYLSEITDLEGPSIEVLMDIARTKKRSSDKFPGKKEIFFTSEGLRWATPGPVAELCAERMGREHVMDITCGQGGQVMSFAEKCTRVTASDLDPLNCLITRLNCLINGYDNVSVFNMDCLSRDVVRMADEGCAVFIDPARPPGSNERTMEEIIPDPRRVHEAYNKTASGFCFEVPPYMSRVRIPFDCETEFVSLGGRINRLNLYIGDLKRSESSAVTQPSGERLSGDHQNYAGQEHDTRGMDKIMNELDPVVRRSGLVGELIRKMGWDCRVQFQDDRRTILWSEGRLRSNFIKNSFEVLSTSADLSGIKEAMIRNNGSKVTLRFSIDPSRYWDIRNDLESGSKGSGHFYLFHDGMYILARKVEDEQKGGRE